ncbi:hypothetical protein McaMca56_000432 [Microsporum canis]
MAAHMADNGAEGPQALPDDEDMVQEYDLLSSYTDTTDYYSLLALSRDPPPTDAAIRSAYRTLTLSFHPDKQPSHLQEAARNHFGKIQTAYETLIDPKKRVVYDLMGEEGVRKQWGMTGLLGAFGEAERMQVGVKTMDEAQFRRWFVRKMKDKERSVLEDLISSKVEMQVGFDATNMFSKETEDSINIEMPDMKPSHFAIGFKFKTPFPSIPGFKSSSSQDEEDDNDDDENGSNRKRNDIMDEDKENMQLVIQASTGGELHRMKRVFTLLDEETNEERDIEQELPHNLAVNSFSLGAHVQHVVQSHDTKDTPLNRLLFPFLGDSSVKVGASLLPAPSLTLSLRKLLAPVPGTYPFQLTLSTVVSHSPLFMPPPLHVSVQRQIGDGKLMFCNWSSGIITWPSFIASFFESIAKALYDETEAVILAAESSKFELGLNILPKRFTRRAQPASRAQNLDEEDEAAENSRRAQKMEQSETRQNWGIILHSSPGIINLSLNYGRNLFTSEPEEPALSQWSYEGYTPRKEIINSPPVRLEIATTVSLDLSTSWMISGVRKFGNFTHMGLSIGIQGGRGLVCTITWNRLGQTLKFPIAICPMEVVDADIASLAVIVPWLTYSIMEFGYWRPRQRRKQKKAIARQQRRVQRLLAKRKADSLEAIELMKEHISRRQDVEEQRGGLVILHAEYGYIPPHSALRISRTDPKADEKMVDVTIPVAALVDQGQLSIPRSIVKGEILGFSDPAPFLPKTLRIQYIFGWKKHSVEIADGEDVICPMQSHLE